MFRTSMRPSSGENYCIHATLVFVTLYGWRLVCRPDATHTERRIPTSIFCCWWAHGCPKLVQKRNKYIEHNCAPSWTYLQDYTGMHGQHNIKKLMTTNANKLERVQRQFLQLYTSPALSPTFLTVMSVHLSFRSYILYKFENFTVMLFTSLMFFWI